MHDFQDYIERYNKVIHKIFTVYDIKAEAYLPPFFLHAEGMAVRVFANAINDPGHQFGANPTDYSLFQLGEYDDNSGVITATEPKFMHQGLELLAREKPELPEKAGEILITGEKDS